MVFGEEMVAVRTFGPVTPVRVSPEKLASPATAALVVVPVSVTSAAVRTTFCVDSEPVVTRFWSASRILTTIDDPMVVALLAAPGPVKLKVVAAPCANVRF
jgi:hypothetical protein